VAGVPVYAALIYGSDVVDDNLVSIDSSTMNGQVIGLFGPSGPVFAMTGLAFDPIDTTLYGISPSTDAIYTINPLTGFATLLATVSTGGNPNGLAFDSNHSLLYLTDNNSNGLYSYNVVSSEFQLVGAITGGFSNVEGLGYDPQTDTLFGLADDQDQIIRIDTSSAEATALPNALGSGTWRGLDFDYISGMLFATRVNDGAPLTVIDPLTGIGIDLGKIIDHGRFDFVQGLAVVPEPSTLVLLACACGLVYLRHQCEKR